MTAKKTKAPAKKASATNVSAEQALVSKNSSAGKSSLLKELESVFQTAPKEYDVDENDDFHTKAMFEGDSDENDSFVPALSSKSMAFLDDAPEYQGKKTSAKQALDLSSDESRDEENLDVGSVGYSSSDSSNQSDDDDDDDSNLVYDPQAPRDEEKKRNSSSGADSSRVLEIVRQARVEQDIKVTKVDSKEAERSAAASAQRDFLDCLLEFRIRLQKPLSIANRLPRQHMACVFAKLAPECLKKRECAIEACGLALHSLLTLRCALSSQFPGCPAVAAVPVEEFKIGSKRSAHVSHCFFVYSVYISLISVRQDIVDFAAECVKESDEKLSLFRDATIDKWNLQATGNLFAGGTKMKALNRTVIEQVRSIMADEDSAMKRVRLKRSQYRVIGSLQSAFAQVHEQKPPAEDGDDDRETEHDAADKYDAEIYDDTDFYQVLLRDLMNASEQPASIAKLRGQLQDARTKKMRGGRVVDTRASKGRKLRYEIQPKLVHFMFPAPDARIESAEDIHRSLFRAAV
jgi:protein AATF/BFR2